MTELRDQNDWEPYLQGAARSRRLAGEYVSLTAKGDMAISQELSDMIPAGKRFLRVEYNRAHRQLRLTVVTQSEPSALAMQRKGKGRQIRVGTAAGMLAWGLIPPQATRYAARWVGDSILAELDRPFGGKDLPAPRATSDERRATKKDPIDPIDPIDSASASSASSAVPTSALPDDLIDMQQVLQLTKCSEPTLYNWRKARGFPAPVEYRGKHKAYWSRWAVAQWLVDRDAKPATRRSRQAPAAKKVPKTCQTCADMRALGKRMLCRCDSGQNPNRNKSVEPQHTCDWHRTPGTYVPARMDDED